MTPPVSDSAYARWLAVRAGEELLALRADRGHGDPAALKDVGDKAAHNLLVTELARGRPADLVLSEEGVRDAPERAAAERVWIVDPLDGTREFSEEGRTDWAVHVALWQRSPRVGDRAGLGEGGALAAGAVALPAQHRTLATDQPPGYPPATEAGAPVRIAVSRTRPPDLVHRVAEEIGAELVPMGSAGAKISAVIVGDVDAYLHAGGQYEWDSAAPVAVARATGLHASRADGSTLEYNQPDPYLPDLLVCRRELAGQLLNAIQRWL